MNASSQHCASYLDGNRADLIITNSPNPALNNTMHITTIKEYQDIFVADKNDYSLQSQPPKSFQMSLRL